MVIIPFPDDNCILFAAHNAVLLLPSLKSCLHVVRQNISMAGKNNWSPTGKNTVMEIDKERLLEKYTTDDRHLKKPQGQAKFLREDEFLLHKGHEYATIIIDLEMGHVLWLAYGKKKKALYDFIDFVGEEWMDGVEAVACDMNSDYQEVFEDRCPT